MPFFFCETDKSCCLGGVSGVAVGFCLWLYSMVLCFDCVYVVGVFLNCFCCFLLLFTVFGVFLVFAVFLGVLLLFVCCLMLLLLVIACCCFIVVC